MLQISQEGATATEWQALVEDVCSGVLPMEAHFQPIVDLRRATVCGYEALSRFPPGVGQPPDRWFAAAGRLGLGAELERRALETILTHRSSLESNCFLSLNLGPDAACTPDVQELLLDQGDLRGVVLEITEQTPVEDYAALQAALAPLRELGAAVAVDDAGAGYSSMRHIVALEPQFVKLDRSLIQGADTDPRKVAAIAAIGAFAGELDAWVVAEGIETESELHALASLDLPLGQGFLLGRPAPDMAPIEPGLQQRMLRQASRPEGGVGALMQIAISVAPGERPENRLDPSIAAQVAVRVDEFDRPVGLLVRRGADIEELPVMCTEPATPAADLALRAMVRESGLRFTPAACCDGRGRLLGLVSIERLVESLARG